MGHWVINTVLGHKSNDHALLTLVESKKPRKIIRRISSKTSEAVTDALDKVFKEYSDVQNIP